MFRDRNVKQKPDKLRWGGKFNKKIASWLLQADIFFFLSSCSKRIHLTENKVQLEFSRLNISLIAFEN